MIDGFNPCFLCCTYLLLLQEDGNDFDMHTIECERIFALRCADFGALKQVKQKIRSIHINYSRHPQHQAKSIQWFPFDVYRGTHTMREKSVYKASLIAESRNR